MVSGTATCSTATLPNGSNAITAIFTPAPNSAYLGSQGTTTQSVLTTTSTNSDRHRTRARTARRLR